MHLCKCNGVCDLLALPMCYRAEFGRSGLKDVSVNTEPQNWGAMELHSFGMGGVAVPKIHTPPHMCYHVKFGIGIVLRQRVYA